MAGYPGAAREEVLQIITNGGGLRRAQIMRLAETVVDEKQLANTLYNLKAAGYITLEDGRYHVAAQRPAAPPPDPDAEWPATPPTPVAAPKPARPRPHDVLDLPPPPRVEPTQHFSGDLLEILERAAQDSQDALDRYVWSVGDPAILKPLMQFRNAACEALAAYQEVHTDA